MNIDREYQRKMLEELDAIYPDRKSCLYKMGNADQKKHYANFFYLKEHGLVDGKESRMSGQISYSMRLTGKGIDFLKEDGGLSAILGVVTVKFHQDTIKELIELKIEESDLPQTEKKRMIDGLRSLPVDSIKHLTLRLLDIGIENLPEAVQLIGNTISRLLL